MVVFLLFITTVATAYAASFASIHLDIIGNVLGEGSGVTFSGILTSPDGTPIANRTIFIEDDSQYTRPDTIVAIARTGADGRFDASWTAVPKDSGSPYHFYAEFLGGRQFGFTRSETYESMIKTSNQTPHDTSPSKGVPGWFLEATRMWEDGKIRDLDYAHVIENLAGCKIIKPDNASGYATIPFWVRNDAGLLSQGRISTQEYIEMLGYLVKSNTIR